MSLSQMNERCPHSNRIGIGELLGHELMFPRYSKKRNCGVASVEPNGKTSVWGVLFELTDEDLASLDKSEDYRADRNNWENGYNRQTCIVRLMDGTTFECITYVATAQAGQHLPNAAYKKLIVDGAVENLLPEEYLVALRNIITD